MTDGFICPECRRPFGRQSDLSRHLNASGHKAGTLIEALAATHARAVPCTYPDCKSSFRTRKGLRIHRTLKGHQAQKDSLTRGDGPQPEPRVHTGPRQPVEVDETTVASISNSPVV